MIFCSERAPGRDRTLWSNFVRFGCHFGSQNGSENQAKTTPICRQVWKAILSVPGGPRICRVGLGEGDLTKIGPGGNLLGGGKLAA